MNKTPGAELAAMRRTETKTCPECGEEFTGLVKTQYCKRCRNKLNVRQFREKRRAAMTTAQKIVSDPKNSINGRVQHNRIANAAEQEPDVEITGTDSRPYYKFADGSSITINHRLGDYDINWPKTTV